MNKIVVLTNIPSPPQVKWIKTLGSKYKVTCIYTTNIKNAGIKRPHYWIFDLPKNFYFSGSKLSYKEFNLYTKVLKYLRNIDPDILMISSPWFSLDSILSYLWAVINKKKIIMGPIEFSHNSYSITKIIRNKLVYRYFYSKVHLFMANAYMHYDYLKMTLGLDCVDIFCNFDDYEDYIRHPLRLKNNEVVFMYGGRSDTYFRIQDVIDTFEKLLKEFPKIRLNISTFGENLVDLKKQVSKSSELKQSVKFFENQNFSDIEKIFSQSDVIINYATYSPGGGVILSAVASGMGIISSNGVHSSRLYTIDNFNSFIVSDLNDLYNAMKKYITTDALGEHSKRSKDIAMSTLTMERHLEDFINLTSKKIK